MHSVRGIPLAVATAMMAVAAVASLVGSPLAGALIDRRGPVVVMVAGLGLAAGGLLMVAFGAAAVGVAVNGLGLSLSIPALTAGMAAGPLLTAGAAATGATVALLCTAVALTAVAGVLCRPARAIRP
ncbi:hypothetical protein [Actinoplanes sp. L3-i22]|uniref:hypothetical protein n=1 Tax=Actinoplanes sp. L3-i22 TaxID=2836373 RepID=UPI001C85C276|nr:hypothetical protein [Actinoplanes sp. L3-i22]